MDRKPVKERIEPTLPAGKAISLLKEQVSKIDALLKLRHENLEYKKWMSVTEQLIVKAFGIPHDNLVGFKQVGWCPIFVGGKSEQERQEDYLNDIKERKALLEGFIEQLEKFGGTVETEATSVFPVSTSRKIFIVHGHNEQAKTELASILTRLDFQPIILHEQPNKGMTVIEKLEANSSDVGYAFILLTPDDLGCKKGYEKSLKPRARQNVVFEFGMFAGKLKRNKVCCLYSGETEVPSDLQGLVYIQFNTSVTEKQVDIAKELKGAGYTVDFNKIL